MINVFIGRKVQLSSNFNILKIIDIEIICKKKNQFAINILKNNIMLKLFSFIQFSMLFLSLTSII